MIDRLNNVDKEMEYLRSNIAFAKEVKYLSIEAQKYVLDHYNFDYIQNPDLEIVLEYLKRYEITLEDIPIVENLHQKVYESVLEENTLSMEIWHSCETKHCWAGWIIHIANGYWLQNKIGAHTAAKLIVYFSSKFNIEYNMFYTDNIIAMKNIKMYRDLELGLELG